MYLGVKALGSITSIEKKRNKNLFPEQCFYKGLWSPCTDPALFTCPRGSGGSRAGVLGPENEV